ncbi:MAG: hypothetical protein ACPGPF_10470, partial [Pontibacterium sp.]
VFLHQPKLLLLDEVTANVDTDTEALLFDSLQTYLDEGGSIIFASHRAGRYGFFSKEIALQPVEKNVAVKEVGE